MIANVPTMPGNRPTAVPGRSNGQMQAGDLIRLSPTCLAFRPAAPSIWRLLDDAHGHGISLIASECYRPIDVQTKARTGACTGGNCACAGPPGHSMHGWGKAIDFEDAKGSITNPKTASYLWLKANAARFGWNHPQWAETGPCPEAWHWEWVGDGGIEHRSSVRADVAAIVADGDGYALCTGLSQVIARGPRPAVASSPPQKVSRLIVGATSTPSGSWTVDGLGNVRAYGEAKVLSRSGGDADPDVVAMAATPSGNGYWLVMSSGRVLSFGDAHEYGSAPAKVVGIAVTSSGNGYWLATSDGRVYAFGDATPQNGALPDARIVGIASSPRAGFWLVSETGGVFTYGGAAFLGALTPRARTPVVGIAATHSGYGYWLATARGGVFAFGDAPFYGTA